MAGNISIKLNLDGALQLKQQLEETGNTGSIAFDKLRNGLERLGAQDTGSVVQALQRITQAQQQAVAATAQAQTAAFAGIGPQADYKSRAADVAAYGASMDALRAKYNPLFAASKAYESTLDEIAQGEKVGALSAAEASAARDRVTASFAASQAPVKAASTALKEVTTTSGAAAASMRGLGIQVVQGLSGIATGQPILTTLIQQGHQVVDQSLAMGTGFGGIATAAKGLVAAVGGLPVLLGGVVVGAFGLMVKASDDSIGQLNALKVSLRGTHDDFALLAQNAEDAAKRISGTSGLGFSEVLSVAKTIEQGKYFSSAAGDIKHLSEVAIDLGAQMGGTAADGAKKLAEGLNDPLKAAQSLSGTLSTTLTPELLRQIDLAQKAGDTSRAYSLFLGGVETGSKGAAVNGLSPLTKAWQELGNAFTSSTQGWHPFMEALSTGVATTISNTAKEILGLRDAIHAVMGEATIAGQQSRDLAAGKTSAATATGGGNGSLLTQPGQQPLLGPVIPGSDERAVGIMQLLPSTAKGMGYNPNIPDENIAGGLTYLRDQIKDHKGSVDAALAQYGGYGTNVAKAAGYIGNVQGQDVSKLPSDVSSSIEYWGQILGLSDAQITLGKKMALVESGGRQYAGAATKAVTLDPIEVTAEGPTRPDHMGGTSSANKTLAANDRYLSESISADVANSRAIGSQDNAAALLKTAGELNIVNRQLAEFSKNGDTSSEGFKQATANAEGLKQKTQELLAAERNRLDPQQQYLRGMQDQVAANAGLTEGDQRVVQLRQQMADIERNQGGSFTPEQRAAALGLLSQTQQQELARQVDTMRTATAGQDNLAAAYSKGYDAVAQATAGTSGYVASLKYGARGSDEQRAAAASLTAEFERQAAAANKLAVAQATRQNADQLTYLDAETKSLGMNDNARTTYLAHLQAEQFLLSKNISLTSEQGAAYLASVDKISAASAALKGQEASLNELTGFFDNTFSTISDSIVSAFATGEQSAVKFKDVAASVVKAVEAEFIKLALVNPLKNLLLGSSSPDLLSVGGIVGKLLGNVTGATANPAGDAAAAVFGGQGGIVGSAASAVAGAQTSILSGVGSLLSSFSSSLTGGTISTIGSLGSAIVSQVSGSILGNLPAATNLALAGAGSGVYGVATAGEVAIGAASATTGISTTAITSAVSTVASALPAIGAAISVITDLVQGNYRGAGLVAGGALIGTAILPGIGTAVGAAIGGLVDAFLPNHPKHPFEDVELNVAGGRLATGKSDGQLADVDGLVAGTKNYVDNINGYLDSVGVKIATADGNIGRIGQGITGLAQTLDPSTTFKRLDFTNATPNDKSNFSIAKGALDGMKFDTPQALADELSKIAGFADAASTLGIQLASVGKDITNIAIASVSTGGQLIGGDTRRIDDEPRTTTVKDNNGLSVTFLSDLRTALNADLPKQNYADTAALDAEIQKVSTFLTGSLPSLLTPMRVTQSTIQDQYNAIRRQYDGAEQQSKAYGLNNDGVLNDAMNRALAIFMEPTTRALNTATAAVASRFANLALGTSGSAKATNDNLAYTQLNERAALDDSWRQAWGDSVTASDAYKSALQQLVATQNLEAEATRQQMALAKEQGLASLAASEADFAKRAGMDSLSQQLAAYDTKAAVETDTFIASWRAYYGQYAATGDDFQNQMIALYKAHYTERLQIETDYATTSNAALKTAQGSVSTLFGSLKDYALKLQTGSQSALSPMAQYDLAKSQFQAVAGAAAAGDATSASQLTTYADALLSTSRAVNDSGAAYAADFKSVVDSLQGVTGNVDALTQSFIAKDTQNQTDQLKQSLDDLGTGLQSEIAALRREMQGQTRLMMTG